MLCMKDEAMKITNQKASLHNVNTTVNENTEPNVCWNSTAQIRLKSAIALNAQGTECEHPPNKTGLNDTAYSLFQPLILCSSWCPKYQPRQTVTPLQWASFSPWNSKAVVCCDGNKRVTSGPRKSQQKSALSKIWSEKGRQSVRASALIGSE